MDKDQKNNLTQCNAPLSETYKFDVVVSNEHER
jgi:hypothetical protein